MRNVCEKPKIRVYSTPSTAIPGRNSSPETSDTAQLLSPLPLCSLMSSDHLCISQLHRMSGSVLRGSQELSALSQAAEFCFVGAVGHREGLTGEADLPLPF